MEPDYDGAELGLSFDFEVDAATDPTAAAPYPAADHGGGGGGRSSFRKTVCRHWMRGLCMKGEACGFLHQYDKDRMPLCRFFRLYGECREKDCVYKHSIDDLKECNMYKLGFCPNGPDCRYRHVKLPGPPPPIEEVFQKIQQINSHNYGNSNRFFQNRNSNYPQQNEKPQFTHGQNGPNQGLDAKFPMTESPGMQMQQSVQPSQQQVGQNHMQSIPNGQQNQGNKTAIPLPQGTSRCVQTSKGYT